MKRRNDGELNATVSALGHVGGASSRSLALTSVWKRGKGFRFAVDWFGSTGPGSLQVFLQIDLKELEEGSSGLTCVTWGVMTRV